MPQKFKKPFKPLPSVTPKILGFRIAKIRKNRGLTQLELANKIGIRRGLISDYETGRLKLSGELIAHCAMALNVTTDELLGLNSSKFHSRDFSLKFSRRIKQIESLPEFEQKHILKTIDSLVKAAEVKTKV
ncbi:hypothetical protein S1OALGB6SA_72 [Olavius algarvensis spirochete endosymbiont]|uniref:helix-turn-helix domain-containing protein n=1 Tax=Olavius algarvensis spirochete endosymbiont TaxID=260710 RepID=UPI000F18B32E|nr:helix-turn-helix transcriptional regulator [Olavius algarvensis spirochete endosymbiont]VDA99010.1 hypothetical protein S1OALGB6SA_72 [Olavius algarvensis spirochete endosymbiont]